MNILLINEVCGYGSTGKICGDIAKGYHRQGHNVRIAYGRHDEVPDDLRKYSVRIGGKIDLYAHVLLTRLADRHGFGSGRATDRFLKWADEYNPDLVWLHNIHGYYINFEKLFQWIKNRPDMKVKWTLHDCWAFTGHCAHFTMAKCEKWKRGCHDCPERREYPRSLFVDNSRMNYRRKRSLFTGVKNMELITPSQWLADLVGESFLKRYPVEVVRNEIDRKIFHPNPGHFKSRFGIEDKIMVLGVASPWNKRKGLDDFIELAGMLDDRFVIVLVGLSSKQIRSNRKGERY